MSLIERLVFSFISDTAEFKRGSKEVEAGLDGLGKKDDQTTEKFQKNNRKKNEAVKGLDGAVLSLKNNLTELIAPLAGFIAIANVISGSQRAFEYADRVAQLSESLDVSQKDLSAWGGAIESVADGSLDGLAGSIKSVSKSIELMTEGLPVRAAKAFEALGIDATKYSGNVLGLFEALNPMLADMEAQKALAFGEKIGLDEATIRLLRRSPAELKKIIEEQKKYTAITEKAKKVNEEFGSTWDSFAPLSRAVFMQINNLILPVLGWFLDKLSALIKFMLDHKPFAMAFFAGMALVIGGLLIPTLKRMAIAAWQAVAPIVAMALPFIGLALMVAFLYDEWKTFTEGGKTLLGDLFTSFKNGSLKTKIYSGIIIVAIAAITLAFAALVAMKLWGFGVMIVGWIVFAAKAALLAAGVVIAILSIVATWVVAAAVWTVNALIIAAGWIIAFWPVALVIGLIALVVYALYMLYKNWDKIKGWIMAGWDALKEKISAVYDWFVEKFNAIKEFFGLETKIELNSNIAELQKGQSATTSPQSYAVMGTSGITNANTMSNTSNNRTQNVNVNLGQLNVQTAATDPASIASSIERPLSNAFGQSALQFSGGVVR